VLCHAVDGIQQVRRLRRHRDHAHEAPQDGHRAAAGCTRALKNTLFRRRGRARARAGARACMHVIQCINYKIPSQIRRHAHLLLWSVGTCGLQSESSSSAALTSRLTGHRENTAPVGTTSLCFLCIKSVLELVCSLSGKRFRCFAKHWPR
jgi:hypothetical protein